MLLADPPTSGESFRTTASINSALSAYTPTNLFPPINSSLLDVIRSSRLATWFEDQDIALLSIDI